MKEVTLKCPLPFIASSLKFHSIWYCRNRVSSCNITYVVQQDTQIRYGWIFIQYAWQLDMFRTYRSVLRSIYELCVAGLVCENCAHRATHNLHIPNQQHAVYRCFWWWTCRSEICRAVKHIVNKYSTITKVVYLVGLHMWYLTVFPRCVYLYWWSPTSHRRSWVDVAH